MKLLILGTQILAVDVVETDEEFRTADAVYPKHVITGYQLIEVEALPADYAPGRYSWEEGFVAIPSAPPTEAVPAFVTMRQARLALLENGLLDIVQQTIANMQGVEGDKARIEWEFSSEVLRCKELVASLAAALPLTDAEVDALFIQAALL